jgi:undecaprenyl-diphosphatase
MDPLLLFKALILGIVEGLTEFLPISSTGHLILVGDLLNFNDERGKAFEIIIQFGAILAVCWEYRERLLRVVNTFTSKQSQKFVMHVVIACIPAMGLGLIFGKLIKAHLFSPVPVASAFIVGAFVIFWAEYRQTKASTMKKIDSIDQLTALDALKVGLAQCAALIPGTSRSGATIIGGMLFGLPRAVATEFSFFLAIPVIGGATAYELLKIANSSKEFGFAEFAPILLVGFIAAFISAFICVRWLIHYVAHHNFIPFAWYRIIFGVLVLVTSYTGLVAWSN